MPFLGTNSAEGPSQAKSAAVGVAHPLSMVETGTFSPSEQGYTRQPYGTLVHLLAIATEFGYME